MSVYTVAEVAKILDLAPERVRSFVRQGLVPETRGPRGEFRFSFQDLLMLRTARGLYDARVPARRVQAALTALRAQLPQDRPVSAVQVFAEGDHVVVQDADAKWEPASGQTLFDFEVADLEEKVARLAPRGEEDDDDPVSALAADPELVYDADDWCDHGVALEPADLDRARDAYRRSLELDPWHLEARLNLARLLHDTERHAPAERHLELAAARHPNSAAVAFQRALLWEDMGRTEASIEAFEHAIALDPTHKGAHLNLSRLLERLGESQRALQVLAAFKRLNE